VAIDPNSLPRDSETLRNIVVDLAEQLDRSLAEQNKYQSLLRELLEAQRNRKSEQLSKEQLALFEAAWQARDTESAADNDDDLDGDAGAASKPNVTPKRGGRQPLARHLKRERLVHDLAEAEKHCHGCGTATNTVIFRKLAPASANSWSGSTIKSGCTRRSDTCRRPRSRKAPPDEQQS
jgi:hypothetical protein